MPPGTLVRTQNEADVDAGMTGLEHSTTRISPYKLWATAVTATSSLKTHSKNIAALSLLKTAASDRPETLARSAVPPDEDTAVTFK